MLPTSSKLKVFDKIKNRLCVMFEIDLLETFSFGQYSDSYWKSQKLTPRDKAGAFLKIS